MKIAHCYENSKFKSLLSISDIQRAIIANISMEQPVYEILCPNVCIASVTDNLEQIKYYTRERRNEFIPILYGDNNVTDIIFWEELFDTHVRNREHFNLLVMIMARGQRSGLRPLTNILPKPLIPIGNQTIMDKIIYNLWFANIPISICQ